MTAAGLLLSLALALTAVPDDSPKAEPTYRAAGVAEAECRGGLSAGLPAVVRRLVGCHLETARRVDLAAGDLNAEFQRVYTSRLGQTEIKGASDDLLARWAKDPRSSLAPRADFRPVRVENLEFTEAAGYDRTINPTGGVGLATREATALSFHGRLISETAAGPQAFGLTGRLTLVRGSWTLTALDLSSAGPPP
jgi:hypothetical protein